LTALRPWLPWYRTQAWRSRAQHQLQIEPLCRMCGAEGYVESARVADHIEDHKGDPEKFWRGALQSLCFRHHNSKTRLSDIERRTGKRPLRRGADASGIPTDPAHPWRTEAS
jgi:hypothetical protein